MTIENKNNIIAYLNKSQAPANILLDDKQKDYFRNKFMEILIGINKDLFNQLNPDLQLKGLDYKINKIMKEGSMSKESYSSILNFIKDNQLVSEPFETISEKIFSDKSLNKESKNKETRQKDNEQDIN